jgi:hypothetical protein
MKPTFTLACSFLLLAATLLAASPAARAEHTRVTNPNSLNAEVFGRGLRYGLGYDRVINDDLAVGFSLGSVNMNTDNDVETGLTATFASPYVNYYFQQEQGSVFLTGGASLVTNSGSVKNLKTGLGGLKLSGNAIVPQFGIGYENRGDSGFLFRMAFYGMVDRNIIPWIGFTLGYAF